MNVELNDESHNRITGELKARVARDQEMRIKFKQARARGDDAPWDSTVDDENTTYMKQLVGRIGWPRISTLGSDATQNAWLLVQHADDDVDFQAHCLTLMQELPKEEVQQSLIAYLDDRVRVARDLPQRYGTQFNSEGDHFGPYPIEDEANLDARRTAMELEPFADYLQTMTELYKN
jgi:hypothetical protein